MNDKTKAMSVENANAVNVRVQNISDYQQMDVFVRIVQIENPDFPLCNVCLSHVVTRRTYFRMYDFDLSCGTRSVIFHAAVSSDDVTMPLVSVKIVGLQVLNKCGKVFLLDGRHQQKSMRQLHVKAMSIRFRNKPWSVLFFKKTGWRAARLMASI